MELSVIIVNYNVKHFLEQCLFSVTKAIASLEAEVIVIDNCSSDNSLAYLQPLFPTIRFIANPENIGFGKACNQGLQLSSGTHVLFLNPDTIVPEDCFVKCIAFLKKQTTAGAVGVHMLDGSGCFLKESKRGFPSPLSALYKLFGLSKLFPRSKIFSNYHLGHYDEKKTAAVDVLAGAFMMIKKEVLTKTGGFDESFFMYGEDVDLSYRIQEAGYQNVYFAATSIIHFKGESTRKGSMNYVRMFYAAMSLFVKKHYGSNKAGLFSFLIHLAIWFRAGLTAIGSFIRRIGLPLIDAGLILLSFWLMKKGWNQFVRPDTEYNTQLLWTAIPAYTLFYLIAAYYAGLYDKGYKWTELIRSSIFATVVLLAAYSLLPEQFRFSRAVVLFGALLAFLLISLLRWILVTTDVLTGDIKSEEKATTIIVGAVTEYDNVVQLLQTAGYPERVLGRVAVSPDDTNGLTNLANIKELYTTLPFREIIFCEGILSFKEIIEHLTALPKHVVAKIHAASSNSIVGSDSKDSAGEAVSTENGYKLANPYNRRLKRLLDVAVALSGLLFFPIHLLLIKKPLSFFSNCMVVLVAKKTWIGYAVPENHLPVLAPAILASNGIPVLQIKKVVLDSLQKMDYWYARDFEVAADIRIIWKNYRNLGG